MRKTCPATTSYEEDGFQGANECQQLLEAGRGKEMDSSLKPPESNAALPHLDFSPSRAILNF